MDAAAWTLEVLRLVGPAGAVVLLVLWLRRGGLPVQPAPAEAMRADRIVELLGEIRDGVRDAGSDRRHMINALDRIERRQSTNGGPK